MKLHTFFVTFFALKIDNLFKVTRHVPRKMIIMFQILNDLIIYQIKIYHYLLSIIISK